MLFWVIMKKKKKPFCPCWSKEETIFCSQKERGKVTVVKAEKKHHFYLFLFVFSFPKIMSCCYGDQSIKTKCSSTDCNTVNSRAPARLTGEFSQLLKQRRGGEMHYRRIYIQYFALWSSHWPGGLIVCVFVCVTTILRNTPPQHCQCISSMGSV